MLSLFCDGRYQQDVRTEIDEDGNVWFHATHVCEVLEMVNPTQSVQRHVDPDFRRQISWGDRGMPAWYLSEPGVYQLGFASKSARSKSFQRWVFQTLLPEVRKTGSFNSIPNSKSDAAEFWEIIDGAIARNLDPEKVVSMHCKYSTASTKRKAKIVKEASKPRLTIASANIEPDETIKQWVDECLVFEKGAKLQIGSDAKNAGTAYGNYLKFCADRNLRPKSLKAFSPEFFQATLERSFKSRNAIGTFAMNVRLR